MARMINKWWAIEDYIADARDEEVYYKKFERKLTKQEILEAFPKESTRLIFFNVAQLEFKPLSTKEKRKLWRAKNITI